MSSIVPVLGMLLTGLSNISLHLSAYPRRTGCSASPLCLSMCLVQTSFFASGTLFIAKVLLPHKQSFTGAMFQTTTQLGMTFGFSVSTIVFNSVLHQQAWRLGVAPNDPAHLTSRHDRRSRTMYPCVPSMGCTRCTCFHTSLHCMSTSTSSRCCL